MTSAVRATMRLTCALILVIPALPQGRGGSDWSTNGGDAQRSGWVRSDPKISAESMTKPGFQFMWKVKFRNDGGALSAPVLQDRYIGYRGFRTYAFIGGTGDSVFALDSDLSRIEWQKHFPLASKAGTNACPGGMTADVTRDVTSNIPGGNGGGGGGRGRGTAARSAAGAPGEGAVTISQLAAAPARGTGGAGGSGGGGGAAPEGPGRAAAGPGRGRMPAYIRALSSDGAFHNMYVSNGEEPDAPIKFIGPGANASGLIVVDEVAYAITSGNCGGVPDGLWALDLATKSVANWKGTVAGTAGPAFGPDGTVFIASASGDLLALEPKTLKVKSSYNAGQPFQSSPVLFEHKNKTLVAAAAKDGSVYLADTASLTSATKTAASAASALATWSDASGTTWILGATPKGIAAWKLSDQGGSLSLQPGWTSRDISSSTAPAIVNGIVFAAASGAASTHATLYALDATTGKELWSSANTITSYIPSNGGLASGGSAVYLGTHDGTFWAFGFPIEH